MSQSSTNRTGSRKTPSGGQANGSLERSICAFWLGNRCFGLDVGLVGEVVTVTGIAPVPNTPSCVLGLFNLRGMPVAIVDLAQVLEFSSDVNHRPSDPTALVLRTDEMVVGVIIDRMEAVIPGGRGLFTPADNSTEHPVVRGFLELTDSGDRVITLLDPPRVVERLDRLRQAEGHTG